ncbi:MAG: hypothetical protein HY043_21915 [Verrucomicrobia bacterium]|nr:hypothetical protein [Verrucomicrobiota bacterium]
MTTDSYRLDIHPIIGGLMKLEITGATGVDYELQKSADLKAWDKLVDFRITTSHYPFIDVESATNAVRFYRLQLKP